MNNKIKALNKKLAETKNNAGDIEAMLQKEYDLVFAKNKELKQAIAAVEDSKEYDINEYGEVYSWIRFDFSDFEDCKTYLENYLREYHFIVTDFKNDSILLGHGSDNLIIQDDTRHDNGVWLEGKCVIDESEYKDDSGEIDETKRNELIEKHMEKTGFYPGVFRVDRHGNVFAVKTTKS